MAEIAHFHDTKSESSNYRLVFVKNSDAKSTSIVLETCVTSAMLNSEDLDDAIIKSLLDKNQKASLITLKKQASSEIPLLNSLLITNTISIISFVTGAIS